MKILFVHQNFPGQFPHLAPALAARGHEVLALTDEHNRRPSPIKTVRYKAPPEKIALSHPPGGTYAEMSARGLQAARAARVLRDRHGFSPDLILGHSGWGETLFLKEVWPEARLAIYAELLYRTRGQDVGFDPEFGSGSEDSRLGTVARSAHLVQAMVQADAALSPTRYQADSFPPELRGKITVIHDGIDSDRIRPDPAATLGLPGIPHLTAGDEVLTYVGRSLEPYRGFHILMRALPGVLAARPRAQVVIVGGEGTSYGAAPKDAESWKAKLLAEVGQRIDPSRVHFTGRVPFDAYVRLLQVSRAHAYLTYPFVLSWSLTEAMAAGCQIIASDTEPVREVVADGANGRLVPFFDIPAWERALIRALDPDPEAPRLGAAARRTILDRYDLKRLCLPRQIDWIEALAPSSV
ncbi:glycosyltransferase [Paracoccus sp. S-4012]|uniref:glycosyltransferase n=1 Tax=Paracoccus sp. S-4012 TaxID=2665648 RepID=UPI0012AFC12C|nr:glycosyltransferase [Paracoccus sp. S-4012]MRX50161.1 glycosyltransferase [Paracoccus sp. S-4012]